MKTNNLSQMPSNPFDLELLPGRRFGRLLGRSIERLIKRILLIDDLEKTYRVLSGAGDGESLLSKLLQELGVQIKWRQEELNRIPRSGPVLVVANHPFGALDGMALIVVLRMVRPDVKVMANCLLQRIPELRDLIIAVDPFGSKNATRANLRPLREAVRWLKEGGLLAVFPAGGVSHVPDSRWQIIDPPWSPHVAVLIRKTRAETVPVFFEGCNTRVFRFLGKIHPRLRTALLPREMMNRSTCQVRLRVGFPVPPETIEGFPDDEQAIMHLRVRTYLLGSSVMVQSRVRQMRKRATPKGGYPIISKDPREHIRREMEQLLPHKILAKADEYAVIEVSALESPNIIREIGRLREITFREVGEGTGKPIDVDRFDEYYVHLCLVHRQSREIVGAYRLGPTDAILPVKGLEGLYTYTLFLFDKRFLNAIGPALEVGRSFVRREFQKDYYPLLLLWKGIGAFLTRHPRYKVLFGPVSVSPRYRVESRQLIMEFLQAHRRAGHLSDLVQPRRPFRAQALTPWEVRAALAGLQSVRALSDMISSMENDGKGLPILMKHYLKLGGEFVCFSEDPNFSNVLDGLILVDLARTKKRILEKYLGRDGTRSFLAHHQACEMAG